jgi:hypothetical protein
MPLEAFLSFKPSLWMFIRLAADHLVELRALKLSQACYGPISSSFYVRFFADILSPKNYEAKM